jgi:hypothetical protein
VVVVTRYYKIQAQ